MPCDPRRLPKITGTRVDAWLWRYYGCPRRATRGGIGRLSCDCGGGAALLVVCPVSFLDVCAGTASRGVVRFLRTGSALLLRGARRARCPGKKTQGTCVLYIYSGAISRPGEPETSIPPGSKSWAKSSTRGKGLIAVAKKARSGIGKRAGGFASTRQDEPFASLTSAGAIRVGERL